jgi:hypothetical protein
MEIRMVLSYGIWLLVLGVLGASNLIIAKRPDAQALISKLAPFQGWIGAVSVLYGIWEIIGCIGAVGMMGMRPPIGLIFWILYLANALLQVSLGLLLGVGVLKTFIKNEQARAKMDQTITKLAPYQGVLGLAAIGTGIAFTVIDIIL